MSIATLLPACNEHQLTQEIVWCFKPPKNIEDTYFCSMRQINLADTIIYSKNLKIIVNNSDNGDSLEKYRHEIYYMSYICMSHNKKHLSFLPSINMSVNVGLMFCLSIIN